MLVLFGTRRMVVDECMSATRDNGAAVGRLSVVLEQVKTSSPSSEHADEREGARADAGDIAIQHDAPIAALKFARGAARLVISKVCSYPTANVKFGSSIEVYNADHILARLCLEMPNDRSVEGRPEELMVDMKVCLPVSDDFQQCSLTSSMCETLET